MMDSSPTLLEGLISGSIFRGSRWPAKLKQAYQQLPEDLPFIALLILLPLAAYLKTLQPSLYFIDAGVLVTAAAKLGIPQPPGYPAFTLISHLFTYLPIGDYLYRVQLFSITFSIALVVVIYYFSNLLQLQLWGKVVRWASVSAAFMLAFSYQFWSQTLNTQPYIFTDFLLISTLLLVVKALIEPAKFFRLATIGLPLLILASGGSTVMFMAVIPALLVLVIRFWNQLGIRFAAVFFLSFVLMVLALYSFLMFRARQHPFLNWGDPETWELFLAHVQGLGLNLNDPATNKYNGFVGDPFIFVREVGTYFYLLAMQFTPIGLVPVGAGIWSLWKQKRWLLLLLLTVPGVNILLGGLWLSGNHETWFIISYAIFSLLASVGFVYLYQLLSKLLKLKGRYPLVLQTILILLALAPLFWWGTKIDRSDNYVMRDYANNLYANLPKDAVLIGIYDSFQAATLDRHELRGDRADVFPVMTNMIYVLPWYREHLRRLNPELMPQEIDKMTTFNRESEYSDMLNYYVEYLIKKGKQVYVTQPVFSRSVLLGTNGGVFTPDPKRFKTVPAGLTTKIVATDSAEIEPNDSDFQFKFLNPDQYKTPHYYLEQGYVSSYQDLVAEYATSYIAYAEKLLEEKKETGQQSMFGGLGGSNVSLNATTSTSDENKRKAADYLQKAYDIAPDSLEVQNRLAIAYANQGNFKKTVELFSKAADKDPQNLTLKFNLAKAQMDNGDSEAAKKALKEILSKTKDAQVSKQASSLLSVISASDTPPKGYQSFKNDALNVKFNYPEGFSISFSGENMVKVSNNGTGLDELTLLIASKKLNDSEDINDIGKSLPFVMDGVSLGTQPIQLPTFFAKVKTYATGEKTNLLFLLRHNSQGFAVRVTPGNSNKSNEFSTILQSIRPLNP